MEAFDDTLTPPLPKRLQDQFLAIRTLADSAVALTMDSQPELNADASALSAFVETCEEKYASETEGSKGVALATILLGLMRLFNLGRQVETKPHAVIQNPDDPLHYFPDLMPSTRSCIKFVSDEIAALARAFVQSEDGVQRVIAAELRAVEHDAGQTDRDHRLAREIHDRDAAYAASRGFPPARGPLLPDGPRAGYAASVPGLGAVAGIIPAATVPAASYGASVRAPIGAALPSVSDLEDLLREMELSQKRETSPHKSRAPWSSGGGATDATRGRSRGGNAEPGTAALTEALQVEALRRPVGRLDFAQPATGAARGYGAGWPASPGAYATSSASHRGPGYGARAGYDDYGDYDDYDDGADLTYGDHRDGSGGRDYYLYDADPEAAALSVEDDNPEDPGNGSESPEDGSTAGEK